MLRDQRHSPVRWLPKPNVLATTAVVLALDTGLIETLGAVLVDRHAYRSEGQSHNSEDQK